MWGQKNQVWDKKIIIDAFGTICYINCRNNPQKKKPAST